MKRIIDIEEKLYNKAKMGEIKGYEYLHVCGKLAESELLNEVEAEDCISRKDVERLVYQYLRKGTDDNVAFYEDFLDLPSVTPKIEPRKGHWEISYSYDGRGIPQLKCSNCHEELHNGGNNYCPNCGAKMESEEN